MFIVFLEKYNSNNILLFLIMLLPTVLWLLEGICIKQVLVIDHADVIAMQVYCSKLNGIIFVVCKQWSHIINLIYCFSFPYVLIILQNWSHVSTVFEKLNRIPSKQHGTDIMRIRPWYIFYLCIPSYLSVTFFLLYIGFSCLPFMCIYIDTYIFLVIHIASWGFCLP